MRIASVSRLINGICRQRLARVIDRCGVDRGVGNGNVSGTCGLILHGAVCAAGFIALLPTAATATTTATPLTAAATFTASLAPFFSRGMSRCGCSDCGCCGCWRDAVVCTHVVEAGGINSDCRLRAVRCLLAASA